MVIVQNDRHADSYVVAFDVESGQRDLARRPRRDAGLEHAARPPRRADDVVTNSPRFIRGHDPVSGRELWRIEDGTQVKVPTPIVFEGAGDRDRRLAHRRAADHGPRGRDRQGGLEARSAARPYTPTPIVYQGILYVCVDNGVLSAYDARTGKRLYQRRIDATAGGFSASPVAAAGRIYFPSEDGVLYVVRAGSIFELLAKNDMKEMVLATPAIVGDTIFVRTRTHLVALKGDNKAARLP